GGIWEDVLGLGAIGRNENFFELGGHSLAATQVMSRIREAFDVEVGVRKLFETPTVEGLAEAVEKERRGGRGLNAPRLLRATREGDVPLSFAQQRLWFLQQLEPVSGAYNLAMPVRVRGTLSTSALRQSFQEI